ncbi:hypothetical protein [Natronosalvus rutilus]|uniref:Uncharacterized protein n=1 Tax=Natronosalvus rutilus TaxID=2953753 RepID=A0A9E7SV83_9EURY|nr:hypothetical protein [Natronosalvus rutilus]UTF53652.1 hypothetical protein NGM29_18100 [Natronosalvus rutilus]
MNRRTMVAALGGAVAAVAGCLDESSTGESSENPGDGTDGEDSRTINAESVAGHFGGQVERPECTKESETVELERDDENREYETVATIPYPGPPESFDDDALFDYVANFEEAYLTNDVLCEWDAYYVFDVSNSVEAQLLLEWDDEITVMFCRRIGGSINGADEDGSEWIVDGGPTGVTYAVDETGMARISAGTSDVEEYEADGPGPLEEGELVAAFE